MWPKVGEINPATYKSGVTKGNSNSTLLKEVRFNSRVIRKKIHRCLCSQISLEKRFRITDNSSFCLVHLVHLSFFWKKKRKICF